MKLTNYLRNAFVSAVMQDVPVQDFDEQTDKACVEAVAKELPETLRAAWLDPLLRCYFDTRFLHPHGDFYVPVPTPLHMYNNSDDPTHPSYRIRNALLPLAEQRAEAKKARRELENKLHAVVAGCNTRKQLVEALPEFEKYAPQETAKLAGLPAVSGVVADLVAAGWPKGGK